MIYLFNYLLMKIAWFFNEERRLINQEYRLLEKYFAEKKCQACHGIRQEHSVCKVCKR